MDVRTALAVMAVMTLGRAIPAQETLAVQGDLPCTAEFTSAELEALGAIDIPWRDHDRECVAHGISLETILDACGFEVGEDSDQIPREEKRRGWRTVAVCLAPDGYQAVFTAAEIHPMQGPTRAYVVWEIDGAPLPPETGPFRVVVPTDREHSRCIYQLRRIDAVDMRRLIPPMSEQ